MTLLQIAQEITITGTMVDTSARKQGPVRQIDAADSRILYALDGHARMSLSAIAKSTGLTQETVRYRLKALLERGTIQSFYTVLDYGRLGHLTYKVFLRLQNAMQSDVERIIGYLLSFPEIVWLAQFEGQFDLGLGMRSGDICELSQLLDNFLGRYGHFISRRGIVVNIRSEYFARSYLLPGKPGPRKSICYSASGERALLDEVDLLLLQLLSGDCRQNAADLSAKIAKQRPDAAVSRETVLRRIKRLEESKVISGYTVILNPGSIQQMNYKLLLQLNERPRPEVQSFIDSLRREARMVYVTKVLGEWDYEVTFEVEDVAQYREAVMRISAAHPGVLRDYSALLVTHIYCYR
ncbi:MAG TPA: winged helix-turn-helix transcriptional regulator [Oligoflexia bacterium]|nr:winged helix-turn-helix transcriptional regulator [Oligoflexia bacterium]